MTLKKSSFDEHQNQRYHLPGVLLCSFLCGILYVFGEAVWDDHDLLQHIQDSSISNILFSPVGLGEIGEGYYRPLSMLCLKMFQIPQFIHLFILGLHFGTTFFIYHITKQNWIMALLFAIHPLSNEVLGWSSALPDALSTFLSAGIVVAVTYKKHSALIFLCAFTAMLAKENSLVCILIILFVYQQKTYQFSCLLAVFLYLIVRFSMIGGATVPFDWNLAGLGIKGIVWLWGSSIMPLSLTAVRDIWHAPIFEIAIGCFIPILVLGIVRHGESHEKLGALLWIFSPVIAFPTIVSSHFAAERYMYLGLFGMALAFSSLRADSQKAWRVGIFLFLACFPQHFLRASAWKNDINLFTEATKTFPRSSYSYHLLGYSYLNRSDYQNAAIFFEQGLQLEHSYPTERLLLIQSLVLSQQPSKALEIAEGGPKIELTAEYIAWWGRAAYEDQKYTQALQIWKPIVKRDVNNQIEILDGPSWFVDYINHISLGEMEQKP